MLLPHSLPKARPKKPSPVGEGGPIYRWMRCKTNMYPLLFTANPNYHHLHPCLSPWERWHASACRRGYYIHRSTKPSLFSCVTCPLWSIRESPLRIFHIYPIKQRQSRRGGACSSRILRLRSWSTKPSSDEDKGAGVNLNIN